MKKLCFLVMMCFVLNANAQNYFITFAGTGESTTVSSVQVDNLTKGTSLTVSGTDILHLTLTTGINSVENTQSPEMKIYPNPMTDNSIIRISPPEEGIAVISVHDMAGKTVSQIQNYLDNSLQEFRLSGLSGGFYLISVKGSTYLYSGKLLRNGKFNGPVSIEKLNINQTAGEEATKPVLKGAQTTVDMAYTNGNMLKFTGTSGDYSTIITDTPSSDKTITFNFVKCTDGDGNDYPIIEPGKGIGKSTGQIWMAVNLRTTRFTDGTAIPMVTDNTKWSNMITPGYCWFDNNEDVYKNTYGALYNFYTVNTGKLCPAGWHVPSDEEWLTLINKLGGQKAAGGKLKESGIEHWESPNTGATNESGFTALPGGYRIPNGVFCLIGSYGKWWSASEVNTTETWLYYLGYSFSDVHRSIFDKSYGLSVRCLKNY